MGCGGSPISLHMRPGPEDPPELPPHAWALGEMARSTPCPPNSASWPPKSWEGYSAAPKPPAPWGGNMREPSPRPTGVGLGRPCAHGCSRPGSLSRGRCQGGLRLALRGPQGHVTNNTIETPHDHRVCPGSGVVTKRVCGPHHRGEGRAVRTPGPRRHRQPTGRAALGAGDQPCPPLLRLGGGLPGPSPPPGHAAAAVGARAAQRGAPFLLGSSSASRSSRARACCIPALWAAAVAARSIWA